MTTTNTAPKERPVKTIKASGGVRCTIWANQIQRNNETVTMHNCKFTRSYKDEKGNWCDASTFSMQNLPSLVLVAQEAFKFLSLKPEAGQDDLPV